MIYINHDSKKPIYLQIYEQIRSAILSGALSEGDKLASMRVLAKTLNVARNTVEYAYAQLCLEGFVLNKPGAGFFVLSVDNRSLPSSGNRTEGVGVTFNRDQSIPEDLLAYIYEESQQYQYDFGFTSIPDGLFPYSAWGKLYNDVLKSADRHKMNVYNDKQGDAELRKEIARHLSFSRGVRCCFEQIVLCCGMQYSLDLICMLLSNSVTSFAIEEPANDRIRTVITNNRYNLIPVPVESDGINVNALERSGAHAVFVTPSHQFPTGVLMSIQKRMQLLEWAAGKNAIIVEDDYDSELRYHSAPVPSLQSFDGSDRVVYMGSFSKALSPDLRISYLVLPPWLLAKYHETYARYRPTIPWLQQRVLFRFIKEGYLERHIRKLCNLNEKKHDALVRVIEELMGDKVRIHGKNAGSHVVLEFAGGEEQKWLIGRAKEFGVKVYPTAPFWYNEENCPKNTLLIGYSTLDQEKIIQGITLLSKAWFGGL